MRIWIVLLLNLIIVSALGADNRDDAAPSTHAVEVFRCDFGETADANYDMWPDGWTRLRGPGYPRYVKVGIIPEGPTGNSLSVRLDGGAALVSSPAVPVGPRFSYVAEANLRTINLKHDVASITLVFLDEQRKVLEELESKPMSGSTPWTPVRIGPVAPASDKTRFAVLKLHIRPRGREDIQGEVQLAEVKLARLPRMTLRAGGLRHLYLKGEAVEVTTDVSGMSAQENQVVFELLDPYGKVLAQQKQDLQTQMAPNVPGDMKSSLVASASWRPPVTEPGYYRVQVSMVGEDGLLLKRSTSLALIEPQLQPAGRDFGWTLPNAERPFDLAQMATLLSHSGVGWVKFPAWFREDELGRADHLAWFAERLSQNGIELVGLLDQPPANQQKLGSPKVPIAQTMNDRDAWVPSIDPVMMRLSLKVHWWQLGTDDDISYVGLSDLVPKIAEIKQTLERYGQDIHLALPWSPDKPVPAGDTPWKALAMTGEPSSDTPTENIPAGRRWLTLRPLPHSKYDVTARAMDLVQRMIAAKLAGYDTTFAPEPLNEEEGLLNFDGTPGELYLPWRTTALAISGRKHLGSMRLPSGSTNHVFANDTEAVMVLWSDIPTREHVYLGQNVRRVDLWGRRTELPVETLDGIRQHVIEVGEEPVILVGVNPQLVRWCLSFEFERPQLESLFGREQLVAYKFRNSFAKPVEGEFTLTSPGIWETPPAPQKFNLAAGQELQEKLPLSLKPDANSGTQRVRIDFVVHGEEELRFSVLRNLIVGLDDIAVELESVQEESGELVVRAHVINNTGSPVNFRATLFAPDRRREQQPLAALGTNRVTATYRLENGKELVGKDLRLRLEELGGSRVLNNRLLIP